MSLNNIVLNNDALFKLYQHQLVLLPSENEIAPLIENITTATYTLPYLGANEKQIIILVSYENEVYLPDNDLEFLSSILGACQLNIADTAIINCSKIKLLPDAIKQLSPAYIISFGVDTQYLGKEFTATTYTITNFANWAFLYVEPLFIYSENNEARELKRKLWDSLKTLFKLL
jgi:hypothetical protein